jgi:hypothetical protein
MLAWLTIAFVAYDWGTSGGLLQTQYYVSWFLPLGFLAVAVAVATVSMPTALVLSACLVAIQISALKLVPNYLHLNLLRSHESVTPALEIVATGFALLAAFVVSWRSRGMIQPVVLVVALVITDFVAAANLGYGISVDGRRQFEIVRQALSFITSNIPSDSRPTFWVQAGTVNASYFNSIASTHLFLYSIVSFAYPHLVDVAHKYPTPGASLHAGDYVLILADARPDIVAVEQEFEPFGLQAKLVAVTPVRADNAAFTLMLLHVVK